MLTRLALLLTAAEAIWLIPFTLGCLFLAAVAVERVARWLAPDPDIAAAVERARRGVGS